MEPNTTRKAVTALVCSLSISLLASLFIIYQMNVRYVRTVQRHENHIEDLMVAVRQRDTLAVVNQVLEQREDSLPILRQSLQALQLRLQENEFPGTYPGYYLIVDTQDNRFQLRHGDLLVRTGYCGTGKGWTESDSGLVWDFSTPRGLREIERKGTNPYWYRPDWYWLEQGLRPPEPEEVIMLPESLTYEEEIAFYHDSLTASERRYVKKVPGVLGSYKIDLGDGILLHYGVGRGRNVSHGCIRVSGRDLEVLYRTLPIGAPVLIY